MGEGGAPLWPAGIVGSITHTTGYAAALVAEAHLFSGLGVDAERVGGVTQDLWPRLFDAAERDHLTVLECESRAVMATLFFSAKETAYKAWRMKGALAFRDIRITPEPKGFTADRGRRNAFARTLCAARRSDADRGLDLDTARLFAGRHQAFQMPGEGGKGGKLQQVGKP